MADNQQINDFKPTVQFVIVCGQETFGPFEFYIDAINAGRERCGSYGFVVTRLETWIDPRGEGATTP